MDSSTTLPFSAFNPGCILWLIDPDREQYSGSYSPSDSDSDEDPGFRKPRTMYGHPVMVLHTEGRDSVVVCIVSAFS